MNRVLLSVIVPAYNAINYIERCIRSISQQEYRNLDIVVIDDGSTDGTAEKIDELACQDERIRVVHQQNQGSNFARRKGVDMAVGQYVTFVDSDDWIEQDMYSTMLERSICRNVDLITSNLIYDCGDGNRNSIEKCSYEPRFYDRQSIRSQVYPRLMWDFGRGCRGIDSSVCDKIFRLDMLKTTMGERAYNISLGEDALITYTYMLNISTMMVLDYSGYHYVQQEGSMCGNGDIECFQGIRLFQERLIKEIKIKGLCSDMIGQVNRYIKVLIEMACHNVYGVGIDLQAYIFPFEMFPKDSRIIIYGAGQVGKSYWQYVSKSHYFKNVYWVDLRAEELVAQGYPVILPEAVSGIDFDFVMIAMAAEKRAFQVRQFLEDTLHISKKKIIWALPRRI